VTVAAPETLGAYELRRAIGVGGMGVVHDAVDVRDGTRVAVKVLRPELSEDATYVRRFEREVAVASALRHPHLLPVLDAGEVAGRRYLVMEHAPDGTLGDRLDAGPLPLAEVVRVAAQVGSALDALAAAELVHRDVKPGNVMLSARGCRLADFGLARGRAHTVLTASGALLGTAAYLAPELVEGAPASPASDRYALGAVLFECLAGRPPFTGSVLEVTYAHVVSEPPDPLARRPDVPPAVADVLRLALAKDPEARPVSGAMLAQLLQVAAR
jgi:serine/threonine protein kinase